ncbi:hypothetical protein GCM10027403_30990 [Arthrobacter tecti]
MTVRTLPSYSFTAPSPTRATVSGSHPKIPALIAGKATDLAPTSSAMVRLRRKHDSSSAGLSARRADWVRRYE